MSLGAIIDMKKDCFCWEFTRNPDNFKNFKGIEKRYIWVHESVIFSIMQEKKLKYSRWLSWKVNKHLGIVKIDIVKFVKSNLNRLHL